MGLMQAKAEQIKILTNQLLGKKERNLELVEHGKILIEQLVMEWEELLEEQFQCEVIWRQCDPFSGIFDISELRRIFDNLSSNVEKYGDPERTFLLWNDDNSTVYVYGKTNKVKRGSQTYNDLVSAGRVERGRWMVKPEQQPLNVTNEIIQQMNVSSIINKFDEVITVMNSFAIQVNLSNIYGAIAYITERINLLEDEENGHFMMMNLLEGIQAKLTNTNQGIKMFSTKYAEVVTSIARGNESLIQNIGDLVTQQKAVIQESNKYLQQVEARLQGIEYKPDPPAIAGIQAMIPKQSEMRIDELTEFMTKQ